MPELFVVGEIKQIALETSGVFSIRYNFVVGNENWVLQSGHMFGNTMFNSTKDGEVILNHPIDAYFSTTSLEGFPYLVVEVWKLTLENVKKKKKVSWASKLENVKEFHSISSTWLPVNSGSHNLTMSLWRVLSLEDKNYSDSFLPDYPNDIGRYILENREQIVSDSLGFVNVDINIVVSGFQKFGVME